MILGGRLPCSQLYPLWGGGWRFETKETAPLLSPKKSWENVPSEDKEKWTSLVVQCLRILLPEQGTWVQAPVGEPSFHVPQHNEVACETQLERSLPTTIKIPCATTKTWHSQIDK